MGVAAVLWPAPLVSGLRATSYGGGAPWRLVIEVGAAVALLLVAAMTADRGGQNLVTGVAGATWLLPEVAGWVAGPGWLATVADAWSRLLPALVVCIVVPWGDPRRRRLLAVAVSGGVLAAAARICFVDPFLDASCWRRCDPNPLLIVHTELGPWADGAGSLLVAACAVTAGVFAVHDRMGGAWPLKFAAVSMTVGAVGPGVLRPFTAESAGSTGYLVLFTATQLGAIGLAVGVVSTRLRHWRLRTRLLRLSGDLSAPESPSVTDALRRAAKDPQLQVRYWAPERKLYVDAEGRPVDLPVSTTASLGVTVVKRQDQPVAALVHATGVDGGRLDRALGAALRLVLENEQLRAATLAELHQLRSSRTRIVERGTLERRRLERNLHDGAQQRIVSLSLLVRMVVGCVEGDAALTALAQRAAALTDATVQELRQVARGIHPVVVNDAGLSAALLDLAESSTDVAVLVDDVPDSRFSTTVETIAYAAVAGALADARIRGAETLTVCGVQRDGTLVLDMTDDAAADQPPRMELADQAEALGGSLTAVPWRLGTRLRLELPCGS